MSDGVSMEQMTTHQFYTGCAMIGLLANPKSNEESPFQTVAQARRFANEAVKFDEDTAKREASQETGT